MDCNAHLRCVTHKLYYLTKLIFFLHAVANVTLRMYNNQSPNVCFFFLFTHDQKKFQGSSSAIAVAGIHALPTFDLINSRREMSEGMPKKRQRQLLRNGRNMTLTLLLLF
jgi:hypothetical protein